MTASVGVVVVSYDSASDLPACLTALMAADAVGRVVVVDNASTDSSCEAVRGFSDDRIELLPLGTNTGFAGGCNRGFAALGDGVDVVAFVNPDVEVTPRCLRLAGDALAAEPTLSGVAPRLMRADGETVDSVGQVLSPTVLEVRDRGYGGPLTPDLMAPVPVLAACGALAVYRRAALEAVAGPHGPWAEEFFCFWEDLELGWRLVNAGHRISALPDAVATHGRGAGADDGRGPLRWRRPVALEACVVTNRWLTLVRHLHTLDLVRRLPVLLSWDLALATVSAARRPGLVAAIARRWPLVIGEWRARGDRPRRRLRQLPW
ncbi:MAG: glycosyltransferase family 2 protein [Candidatus Sulfomarinibacteraceae bacterium]